MRVLIAILLVFLVLLAGCSVEAEESVQEEVQVACGEPDGVHDCPKGLVDDGYPGRCPLYVDENGDGVCDLSQ